MCRQCMAVVQQPWAWPCHAMILLALRSVMTHLHMCGIPPPPPSLLEAPGTCQRPSPQPPL
jgi:hypothetical protein